MPSSVGSGRKVIVAFDTSEGNYEFIEFSIPPFTQNSVLYLGGIPDVASAT